MMKYKSCLILLFSLTTHFISAQIAPEREHRIKKSQFPEEALLFISQKLVNIRKIRYYKEIDSARAYFDVKFKKDRLKYSVGFDDAGRLEEIDITVGEVDLPGKALSSIKDYLSAYFKKYRIRKILQKYPALRDVPLQTTLRNAFQNLLIPDLRYELVVSGKKDKSLRDFHLLFDSEGNFISIRTSLPANYDHVLY